MGPDPAYNPRMKLGSLIRRGALLLLVVAALAQYWLMQRTQDAAARLTARLIPHGELHYQRLWPFLWGGARVWGLSFQPEGLFRVGLQAAPGFRVQVRELRVQHLRQGADGQLESLAGQAFGVRLPLADLHGIAAPGPAALPMPSPSELGYAVIEFDLDFRVEYVDSAHLALVDLSAAGAELGRLTLDVRLEGSPVVFSRVPDQLLLRRLELRWADGGLGQRYREVAATRARLSRGDWQRALIARLNQRARQENWKWDAASAAAARRVIADADFLRLRLDPPGDAVIRNMRLYPMSDWPALLGLELATEGRIERPPPRRTWP